MDLPRGTVINDYSKAERLGYWDGEKISKVCAKRAEAEHEDAVDFYSFAGGVDRRGGLDRNTQKQKKQPTPPISKTQFPSQTI